MHFFIVCPYEGWRGLWVQCLSVLCTTRCCNTSLNKLKYSPSKEIKLLHKRTKHQSLFEEIQDWPSMVEVSAVAPCSAWFTPAHSPSRHNLEFSIINRDKQATESETFSIINLSSSHKPNDDIHSLLGDQQRTNIKKIERFVFFKKFKFHVLPLLCFALRSIWDCYSETIFFAQK